MQITWTKSQEYTNLLNNIANIMQENEFTVSECMEILDYLKEDLLKKQKCSGVILI